MRSRSVLAVRAAEHTHYGPRRPPCSGCFRLVWRASNAVVDERRRELDDVTEPRKRPLIRLVLRLEQDRHAEVPPRGHHVPQPGS